jgi:hypothetical protein
MQHEKAILLVEVDGGHHFFDDVYSYSDQGNRHHKVHDLRKERYAVSNGTPMLRICTQTVGTNACDWQCWMRSCILMAAKGTLAAGIYRLSVYDSYNRSPFYMSMREDDAELKTAVAPVPPIDPS